MPGTVGRPPGSSAAWLARSVRDAEVADANGAFARRLPTPPLPPPCGDFATHSAVGRSGLRAVLERAAR
jgi:hypothetical protein